MFCGASSLTLLVEIRNHTSASEQQKEKGLAVRNVEGKAYLEGDMATQHVLSHGNATMQSVLCYRLLYVQINAVGPFGKKYYHFLKLKQTSLFGPIL